MAAEWIDRELRALLQTDDVTIIRGCAFTLCCAVGLCLLQYACLAAAAASQAAAVSSRVLPGHAASRPRPLRSPISFQPKLAFGLAICCRFVMGLLVAYGLEPFSAAELEGGSSSSQAQQAQQAQQAARQAAVTARQRAAAMVAAASGGSVGGAASTSRGGEAGSSATALSSNPVEALQPFLYEKSEHFW